MMESSTELPKRSYPETAPQITGAGIGTQQENGAREMVIKALEWFDKNPKAHPDHNPQYVGLADFKPDKLGGDDLITVIQNVATEYEIGTIVTGFCLKHIFIALKHGFDTYIEMMIEQRNKPKSD